MLLSRLASDSGSGSRRGRFHLVMDARYAQSRHWGHVWSHDQSSICGELGRQKRRVHVGLFWLLIVSMTFSMFKMMQFFLYLIVSSPSY